MKRILAFLCVLAMMLSIVPATAFAAQENQAGAEEIIVLEADASNITIDCDTIIDLNGYNIDGVTVTGGTLYCMDSQTADYTVADGVYGHVTNVTGTVKAAEGYLQVGDSFHAVDLDIYAMTLRAADVGVYYKSNFAADEIVAAEVESFGVALSVVTAPNADNLDTYCGYSVFTGFEAGEGANAVGTSTLLKGIMKAANGDNKNAKNAAMPIYGRAYIKTSEGYFFGETVKRSLQEQVEAINSVWSSLKYSQKAPVLEMLETYAFAKEAWNIPNVEGILVPGLDTEIEMPISVNNKNGIVAEAATVSGNNAALTVPAGAQLSTDSNSLTLTVTPKENSATDLAPADSQVLTSVDVHVDGLVADNTVPMLITLKGCLPKGLNNGNVQLYHVENGQTLAMPLVESPVNHNEFSYDPLTGDVVLAMANFSEIAMLTETLNTWDGTSATSFAGGSGTEADPYLISTAHQLAYFRDQVDAGVTYAGKFVKLSNSIHLDHVNFDPIGYGYECDKYMLDGMTFNGTFDGGNHTISGLFQNGWELNKDLYSYSMAGGGLFASVVNATIRNLKISDANIAMECVDMGILVGYSQGDCLYENIGIYNSKIANYQRATGGVVGEVSPRRYADGSLMSTENTHTFRNIHVGYDVVVGSLWGDFDAPVGGVLGARWDDNDSTLVVMEDVTVAARLDVYNDVTAAYRWHAYRRAGMLIGNTDTPPADGKTAQTATAEFLTCKNVTVHLGDWINYHYCQFTNDNNPGRNYPWVRVEAGENCSAYSNPRYGHPLDADGNQVTNADHTHKDGDECHLLIPFAQLYGGGQGVYGAPAHDGVTISTPVYTVTYMIGTEVDEIIYITDNSQPYTLKSAGNHMQWLDKEGIAVTQVPAGNTKSLVVYQDDVDQLFAHFLDVNGREIASVPFSKADTKIVEPAVPEIEGYHGSWEQYTLPSSVSIVVKPVYTLDETYTELFEDMSLADLFKYMSQGKTVVMTQELSGGQANAGNKECAIVTQPGIQGYEDSHARLNLNGYRLHYNFAAKGNQDWKIFDIQNGSTMTISGGIHHGGVLEMNLTELHDSSHPTMFYLEEGATLILEKGTVLELRYPNDKNKAADRVAMFSIGGKQFALQQSDYPYLKYEHDTENRIKRITVLETTVIEG